MVSHHAEIALLSTIKPAASEGKEVAAEVVL
jgi:hypothetical protein